MSTLDERPKTDLVAECLELAGYDLETGDGAREDLAKPQLDAIAATLAADRGWPAPEGQPLEELFNALTARELRATIAWLCGFEYFDELPDTHSCEGSFKRHGSGWFRREEIEEIHAALEEVADEHR